MKKENKRYYARDICRIFDISKATLFRWEHEGLITGVQRDWRNWRIYTQRNIEEIRKIIKAKKEKKDVLQKERRSSRN